MAKKKLTKAERDEINALAARMRENALHTRRLAERAQAELDARSSGGAEG